MKRIGLGISAVVLLLLIVGIGIWQLWFVESPIKVKVTSVNSISLQEEVTGSGTLKPIASQEIRLLNPSRIEQLKVKTGDKVKIGQTLLQLENSAANIQVAQAQAALDASLANKGAAQANLDLLENANTPAPNLKQTQMAVAQAQANVKQAQESLRLAQLQRDQLTISSKINGTVLEVNVQEDSIVNPQVPLVVIADLSNLNVELELNEVDAGKVKVGQEVEVTSKVLGNSRLKGKVKDIAPGAAVKQVIQGNPSPTVKVVVGLDQISPLLKPGFTVNVAIEVAKKNEAVAVQHESIFREENKAFVYSVEAGKLKKTEVQLGIASDVYQEITAGLNPGDQIVVNPTPELKDKMFVTVESGSETG